MLAAMFLVVATFWLLNFEAYGDVIPSPTSCDNPPCQQQQQVTPPVSGYPSYGAPPPPLPPSGYSIYGAPPPPHETSQTKCPPAPATGVQCCTPPTPYTYGYGYGPPNPYAPPNPYTYVPYGEAHIILPIQLPLVMFFSSLVFLL